MREIKFKYLYPAGENGEYQSKYYTLEQLENHSEIESEIPEHRLQFTGLHDKNGVEIYEGDILKLDNDSLEDTVVEVIFDIDEACWIVGDGLESLSEALPECEVIGNIYQNPELLTKESN